MGKRKTPEKFNKQIENRFEGEYKVVSKYTGVSDPIKILHVTKYPHCFVSRPDYMLHNKYPCHYCLSRQVSQRITKGQDDFVNEVKLLAGDEYTVLGKYTSAKTKLSIRHNTENPHVTSTTPDSFLHSLRSGGTGCKICRSRAMADSTRLSQSQYRDRIKEIYGDTILVSGKYINNHTKMEMIHNTDSPYEFITTPAQLLDLHQGCSACRYSYPSKMRLSLKEINDRLLTMYNGEFIMLSENLGVNTRGIFRHNTQSPHEFTTTPQAILRGDSTCTVCHLSKMELVTKQYLDSRHISYEQQKRFNDCKDKYMLPFDFYLPEYNTIIEDDGEQHHKVVDFFGGEDGYQLRVFHDGIKNDYCKSQGIHLIRINYDEDIESILDSKL